MIIIRKDTVWGPGKGYIYDDVQVAKGVTLTISPGAEIYGGGHKIEAFGKITVKGTAAKPVLLDNTNMGLSGSHNIAGRLEINYAQVNGGGVNGLYTGAYGSTSLTNSILTNVEAGMFILSPDGGDTVIKNNIFIDSAGIQATTRRPDLHGKVEISNNVFDRYYSWSGKHEPGYQGFAISSFGGDPNFMPMSSGNAFLDATKIALELQYDARLTSANDYFGFGNIGSIEKYIYDEKDDLTIENTVHYYNPSTAPQKGIVTETFSFTSLTLPNDVVVKGRLLGDGGTILVGNKLNNELFGNAGNNTINGGLGADTMSGGAGNDTYIVDNARDVVVEYGKKGYDSVVSSVSYTLANNVEMLTLSGTKAINAMGNALANHLVGNGAANVLDGKGGIDVMEGGAGNDVYFVDHAKDVVVEAFGEGHDTVVTSVSYRLAADQEIETLQTVDANGKAALKLTGNEFGNKLLGNAGHNVLDGGGGSDILRGAAGNDTYLVDHAKDIVFEAIGAGIDTVLASVSYGLKAGQEIETLRLVGSAGLNLTGNEFDQALVGNRGANILNGGLGNDVLTGGKGADTFVFAAKLGANNVDHITDFATVDTIRLSKSLFSALAPGQLKEVEFKDIAKAKVDADDHIFYDSRNGSLFYDADGSGKAAAVKFAVLDNKAAITHADFLIA